MHRLNLTITELTATFSLVNDFFTYSVPHWSFCWLSTGTGSSRRKTSWGYTSYSLKSKIEVLVFIGRPCQEINLSGILILDWLLTLNKMVTRPWSHFKFNLFCDSVTSTTINLVDCILSQYFVTLLIKIMFWDHTGIYRKLGPGFGREPRSQMELKIAERSLISAGLEGWRSC